MKLLFVFIPKYWLIAIIIAFIALTYGSIYAMLGYLVLNAAILVVSVGIAIVVHELGHWVGARFVGERTRRMELGTGHVVLETVFLKTKLTIKNKLKSGYVLTIFNNHKYYRLRRVIYVAMGPVANLLLAGLYLLVFPLSKSFDSSICAAYIGGLLNIFVFIGNMIPYNTTVAGIKAKSDGLNIWNLIFNKSYALDSSDELINSFLDAEDALHAADYKKAMELFDDCLKGGYVLNSLIRNACIANMGICKGRLGDLDGYYASMKQVEDGLLLDENLIRLAGPIYHNIAFIHLLRGELSEADKFTQQAMNHAATVPEVRMLRGVLHVAQDNFEKGIHILENDVDLGYATAQNVLSAIYLALAYSRLSNEKMKNKYWSFVVKNESLLTLEVRPVYLQIHQELTERVI